MTIGHTTPDLDQAGARPGPAGSNLGNTHANLPHGGANFGQGTLAPAHRAPDPGQAIPDPGHGTTARHRAAVDLDPAALALALGLDLDHLDPATVRPDRTSVNLDKTAAFTDRPAVSTGHAALTDRPAVSTGYPAASTDRPATSTDRSAASLPPGAAVTQAAVAAPASREEQMRLNYVPVQNAPLKNAEILPMSLRSVHFVLPGGVDDPTRPSGGNAYDRRICLDLPGFGWQVQKHPVDGNWPRPGTEARAELARMLRELPDGTVVLLDGLVACGVPEIIVPEAERLCLAVLVHLPLGDETGLKPEEAAELDAREREVLRAVPAVIATSDWAVRRLVSHHGLAPERVHVAAPGADIAPLASGTDGVSRLLCVAAVTPRKGQHRLVEALATVTDLPWSCVLVGGLDQEPEYVEHIRALVSRFGLEDRLHLAGPQSGAELDASYAAADLMVLTSYAETYGMAVTEALARGIPVLATDVGGLPEAVGRAPDGGVPGILVPPENPAAIAAELRGWFGEADVRRRLKAAARGRRAALDGWATTARSLAGVLGKLRHEPRKAA